jgi:hypothetical protein
MSPTSYQTAPPRRNIIADADSAVKRYRIFAEFSFRENTRRLSGRPRGIRLEIKNRMSDERQTGNILLEVRIALRDLL